MLYFLTTSKGMGHAWLCRTLSRQSVHFSILSCSDLGQGDKEEVRSVD